ncbi:Sec61beta family protein [Giardia muris]|uniref:Sec61beta family protein n=1 Tax=Giardia muris TaxID=5742 RepID=A0A4Z1T0F2_GIAMU|nr:Sec61beta family protein [Giardia muris]|eukprot:TNJ29188.1 Sec61beta family protein [Giardia muris]
MSTPTKRRSEKDLKGNVVLPGTVIKASFVFMGVILALHATTALLRK